MLKIALITRRQSGATLIEILVTLLILAFGMLALGSLQAFSVAASSNASNRAVAASLASEFSEMIRANPTAFAAGNYDIAASANNFFTSPGVVELTVGNTCVYPNCTATTLATMELATIRARVRASLRYGAVALSRPGSSTTQADVWVVWAEANSYSDRNVDGGNSDIGSIERTFENCPSVLRTLNPLPRCFYMRVTL